MGVESALQSRSHEYGDEGGASSGSARRDASIPGGRLRRSRQEAGRFALWFAGTALLSRRSYRQTNVFPERECVSSRGSAKRKRPVRGKIWFRRGCGSLDISDCSLKGNASVRGSAQRSPRCNGGFVSEEECEFGHFGLFPERERVSSRGSAQPPVRWRICSEEERGRLDIFRIPRRGFYGRASE